MEIINTKLYLYILISALNIVCLSFDLKSQTLDPDKVLERLDRIEKNISDLQKGKIEELENSLSSGYISRNEARFDEIETNSRMNFGILEEIQNKINNIEEKIGIIDKDFQARVKKLENQVKKLRNLSKKIEEDKNEITSDNFILKIPPKKPAGIDEKKNLNLEMPEITETSIKEKYENANYLSCCPTR